MGQLLEISWWFANFGGLWRWLLVCLVLTAVAWPLTLRMFRGLSDRGASLAPGVGILLTALLSWLLAQGWFTAGIVPAAVRLALLCVAFLLLSVSILWTSRRELEGPKAWRFHYPAGVLFLLAIVPLPHNFLGIFVAMLLVAGASVACWLGRREELLRTTRLVAVPGIVSLVLFILAFVFFANVRSYLPWATYELSLWQAEKWGNYTHLHGAMQDRWMPVQDLWFDGWPVNYYYLGHLTTATLAKLSATGVREAFNLGLATTFALTISLAFGFTLSLVHLVTRRTAIRWRGRGRLMWHSGMAWGLFGAAAIGLFGNLDAWRQWFTRDADWSIRQRWEWNQRSHQEEWKLDTGVPAATALRAAAAAAGTTPAAAYEAAIAELERGAEESREVPQVLSSLLEQARAVPEDVDGAGARLMQLLQSGQYQQALRRQTVRNYEVFLEEMDRIAWQDRIPEMIAELEALVEEQDDPVAPIERTIEALEQAREAGEPTAHQVLLRQWASIPPTFPASPTADDLWRTWENFSFVRFWDSSRVVKGTPPHVDHAGTITEFPYFSAILGDHHPHHLAIPWTLLALSACVSFLRKGTRLVRDGASLLRRTWPDAAAMALFIGGVFCVNSWDAIVIGPLYGLVLLVGWISVKEPERAWRWIGFAGVLLAAALATALVWNSLPARVPLFGSPLFLFGAVAILTAGLPLGGHLFPQYSWNVRFAALGAAALLIMVVGVLFAPREGFQDVAILRIVLRDVLVFAVLAILAGLWTLRNPRPWQLRLYGWGTLYGLTGGASLFVALPFLSYFQSPLHTTRRMLESTLPPVLSPDITMDGVGFWTAFWEASPINPTLPAVRTVMGDFFMHWGIFLVPVLVFILWRIARPAGERPYGVSFAIAMGALLITALARNYLGYWVGAICLGALTFCLVNAVEARRRAEGPVWIFLTLAFFWTWFVEALKFDDDMSGNYERYNSLFKIYYVIWPMFAGGMVVAIRELAGRGKLAFHRPSQLLFTPGWWGLLLGGGVLVPWTLGQFLPTGIAQAWFLLFWIPAGAVLAVGIVKWIEGPALREGEYLGRAASRVLCRWPAGVAAGLLLIAGLYYPLASTVTRTREFGTWPLATTGDGRVEYANIYREQTLDALAHLRHFSRNHHDYHAINWLEENAPRGTGLLEAPGDHAYGNQGRLSTGAGLRTIISWKHHQSQWRGRAKPPPLPIKAAYYDDVEEALRDLTNVFRELVPELESIGPELQRSLRLSGDRYRLRTLASVFPNLGRMELLRLRREVERHDVTMMQVTDAMMRDAEDIYTHPDEMLVRRLIGRYAIGLVAVGELEQTAFGTGLAERFENWDFEMVYDSREDTTREAQRPSTRIYAVPEDFPLPWQREDEP